VLYRCIGEDPRALNRIWPIAVKLSQGATIHGLLIRALYACERRMHKGESLADPRWADRLIRQGLTAILLELRNAILLYGSTYSTEALAIGIANVANRGIRHKLHIRRDK